MSRDDRKQKKRLKRRVRKRTEQLERARSKVDERKVVDRLFSVFGDKSADLLQLAKAGKTPAEIASELNVSEETVTDFIETFTRLPGGLDQQLLRMPSLLSRRDGFKQLVQDGVKAAKSRQRAW